MIRLRRIRSWPTINNKKKSERWEWEFFFILRIFSFLFVYICFWMDAQYFFSVFFPLLKFISNQEFVSESELKEKNRMKIIPKWGNTIFMIIQNFRMQLVMLMPHAEWWLWYFQWFSSHDFVWEISSHLYITKYYYLDMCANNASSEETQCIYRYRFWVQSSKISTATFDSNNLW